MHHSNTTIIPLISLSPQVPLYKFNYRSESPHYNTNPLFFENRAKKNKQNGKNIYKMKFAKRKKGNQTPYKRDRTKFVLILVFVDSVATTF